MYPQISPTNKSHKLIHYQYTHAASFLALISHNKEGAVSERSEVVAGRGLSLWSGRGGVEVALQVQQLWSLGLYRHS